MPPVEKRPMSKDFLENDKVYIPSLETFAYKLDGKWVRDYGDVSLPLTLPLLDGGIIEGEYYPGERAAIDAFNYMFGK